MNNKSEITIQIKNPVKESYLMHFFKRRLDLLKELILPYQLLIF